MQGGKACTPSRPSMTAGERNKSKISSKSTLSWPKVVCTFRSPTARLTKPRQPYSPAQARPVSRLRSVCACLACVSRARYSNRPYGVDHTGYGSATAASFQRSHGTFTSRLSSLPSMLVGEVSPLIRLLVARRDDARRQHGRRGHVAGSLVDDAALVAELTLA